MSDVAQPASCPEDPENRKSSFWRELVQVVLIALVLVFVMRVFLGWVYVVPSGSMERTLHGCDGCTNDWVVAEKVVYWFRDPAPGDVVVFERPDSWTSAQGTSGRKGGLISRFLGNGKDDFVKRVIAVGGQTVGCDAQNRITIDGKPLEESYVYWAPGRGGPEQQCEELAGHPVEVPQDSLWVMGDNRNNSRDSRFQGGGGARGAVPVADVIGKARTIVWPPSRWSGVGDRNPQLPGPDPGMPAGVLFGFGAVAACLALWIGYRVWNALRRIRRSRT